MQEFHRYSLFLLSFIVSGWSSIVSPENSRIFSIFGLRRSLHPANRPKSEGNFKQTYDKANVPLVGFANPSNIDELIKQNYKMLLVGSDVDISGGPGKVLDILCTKYWKEK